MEVESPRRSHSPSLGGGASSSPEFEFCMANSYSKLELDLHTADELFVDGVLVPLHLLSLSESKSKPQLQELQSQEKPESAAADSVLLPEASICSSAASPSTGSKRWKDMLFKKKESGDDKERKKETKTGSRGGAGGSAELNINIWPFSRSRSAGTGAAARPKAAAMRKSSSAPCSRSNSRGENSGGGGRRWAGSPGRAGVHVGRGSPVWQVRREKAQRGASLNVNGCIGYRNQGSSSCRSEDGDGVTAGDRNGGLFRIKALFTKKAY